MISFASLKPTISVRISEKMALIPSSQRVPPPKINDIIDESLSLIKEGRKKIILKQGESIDEEEIRAIIPRSDIFFLRTNFNVDHVYKLIEKTIEDHLNWDRFNRSYDPYRSVMFAQNLAEEIKDKVKMLRHKRYRIITFLSIIEKNQQGVNYKMHFVMDPKKDNYVHYTIEQTSYSLVATVFLIYKD